jgi:hypothetical protein
MKTIQIVSASLLAFAALCISSRAQTTNYVVNEFNSAAEVTNSTGLYNSQNGWGNWFGGAFASLAYDSTSDSSNNPGSGSMECVANFSLNDYGQWVLFDGFYAMSINAQQFTNLQFDIRFDVNSCLRTNGDGSLDFGYFQVGSSTGYGQDYFGGFTVSATNSLGQPNTSWVHVSIPVNAASDSALTNITGLIFHSINTYYGNTYNGTQTFWLDNIEFVGAATISSNPPPVLTIQKASPGLRIFAQNTITYGRDELATVDQNQSWIGASQSVSYSFKLLDYNPNIAQIQIFLIPVNSALPAVPMYNNIYVDYNATNIMQLIINPLAGSNAVTASVQWKTNYPGNNPNHTELLITNATAVGTWTLTFNSNTNGTLTAPGANPAAFTISDPNAAADFGNPLAAYFGLQPNTSAGIGQYIDYASMSVTNVAGVNENSDFTTEQGLDSSIWQNIASDTQLATTNTPFWVYYTYINGLGYGLGVSDSVNGSALTPYPWVLPEYYNGYADGMTIPNTQGQGQVYTWVLVPSSCLPTVDGSAGGVPSPHAFFRLFNPPLVN